MHFQNMNISEAMKIHNQQNPFEITLTSQTFDPPNLILCKGEYVRWKICSPQDEEPDNSSQAKTNPCVSSHHQNKLYISGQQGFCYQTKHLMMGETFCYQFRKEGYFSISFSGYPGVYQQITVKKTKGSVNFKSTKHSSHSQGNTSPINSNQTVNAYNSFHNFLDQPLESNSVSLLSSNNSILSSSKKDNSDYSIKQNQYKHKIKYNNLHCQTNYNIYQLPCPHYIQHNQLNNYQQPNQILQQLQLSPETTTTKSAAISQSKYSIIPISQQSTPIHGSQQSIQLQQQIQGGSEEKYKHARPQSASSAECLKKCASQKIRTESTIYEDDNDSNISVNSEHCQNYNRQSKAQSTLSTGKRGSNRKQAKFLKSWNQKSPVPSICTATSDTTKTCSNTGEGELTFQFKIKNRRASTDDIDKELHDDTRSLKDIKYLKINETESDSSNFLSGEEDQQKNKNVFEKFVKRQSQIVEMEQDIKFNIFDEKQKQDVQLMLEFLTQRFKLAQFFAREDDRQTE